MHIRCALLNLDKNKAYPRGDFFEFSGTYAGGGGARNWQKKYNIDYIGYAANLEVKFKLNFDEERGSKIEKK